MIQITATRQTNGGCGHALTVISPASLVRTKCESAFPNKGFAICCEAMENTHAVRLSKVQIALVRKVFPKNLQSQKLSDVKYQMTSIMDL